MMSSGHQPLRFAVTSDVAVRITVYDATGSKLGVGHGAVVLSLFRGLYRVHLKRCGIVRELFVDHNQETTLHDPGPPLYSPAPLAGGATSRDYYNEAARKFSLADTCRPLGDGGYSGRLFIFVRRMERNVGPSHLPSEPVTIHDLIGHKLATLSRDTSQSDDDLGYIAFSARVAPGTYRIRAVRSRRELAITIPVNRAAHVFIADSGVVRIDDLRVALTDLNCPFNPESHVARAMESLLAALKSSEPVFPPDARLLLPEAADQDLCFGIASAHQLWRCEDKSTFEQVMQRLMGYTHVPDIAILQQLRQTFHSITQNTFTAPPLMRASLVTAMTRPEFDLSKISPDSAVSRAAEAGFHDSIWCTLGTRAWDDRWIAPTVENLQVRGIHPASIARMIGLPVRTVERTINDLDSKLPFINGSPARVEDVRIPGYAIGEILGRGEQGTVFRATRAIDGQAVALKVTPLLRGRKQRERIEQELDLIQRLSHPGLLVYNYWGALPNDTGMWFDMDLCCGSVFDLLSTADAPLPFDQTRKIALEALDALRYLHTEGVIHGNIKPSNLLLRENGNVAIADVGLAKSLLHANQPTVTRRAAGTVRFTPHEELIDFKHASAASDVWSMAATLYFLFTLDLPRDEYADQSGLDAALENPIVPIAERWVEVPSELAHCIDRALSDDIRARPKDGANLQRDTAEALRTLPSTPSNASSEATHFESVAAHPFDQMRLYKVDKLPSQYELGVTRRRRRFAYIVWGILAIVFAAAVTFLIVRSARDSTPSVGSVHIGSVPSGADVLFDGTRLTDKTPLTIDGAPVGTRHSVRLELARHEPYEETIDIPKNGGEVSVAAMIKPILGKIIIDSVPADAEIHINGQRLGRTPTTITDVDMDNIKQFELRLKGYQPFVQELVWPADGKIRINAKLVH